MTSEEKIDKKWRKNQILAPLEEKFNLSSGSCELPEQALKLLESKKTDDLPKVDDCLTDLSEISVKNDMYVKN